MATVSENTGKPRLDASQKVRNDHELFLEAYERPTQIYRFLKARHTLEPLFLQRNLSYMKNHRQRSKRSKISLEKLVQATEEDLSSQIRSDNHLHLSFESLSKGKDFLNLDRDKDSVNGEGLFREGTMMNVEVLLYRFKHPSPEALVTSNPNSLSSACTSLGRCVVPYSKEGLDVTNSINLPSITIPGSVLSWKGTNGLLGTHMLAFRVSPVVKSMKEYANTKTSPRKRRANADEIMVKPVGNNLLVPPEKQNGSERSVMNGGGTPNGMVSRPNLKRKQKKMDSIMDMGNVVCNGQVDTVSGRYTAEMLSRLHRKVPGGKKLPTVSERVDKMIVSLSRRLLTKEFGLKQRATKKRTELQLLIDGDKPKTQWISDNDIPVLFSDGIVSMHGKSASPARSNPSSCANPRKRNLNNSQPDDGLDENSEQPPAKRPCNSVVPPPPVSNDHSLDTPSTDNSFISDQLESELYCAELVAFDSRQECLLVDGEYELLMQKCPGDEKKDGIKGFQREFSSIERDSLFSRSTPPFEEFKTLTLKFSAKWVPYPPNPRPREVAETAVDLIRLRKDYEKIVHCGSQKRDESTSVSSSISKPSLEFPSLSASSYSKPTVFNFLYNKDTLQQTELKDNFTCPWCSLDCQQLYSLLKHMSLCHPRFKFTYMPSERGLSSVDVRINKLYDTKQPSTDPVESMGKDAMLVRRQPTKLKPTTSLLVEKCEECDDDLSEFTSRKQLKTPQLFRTFYHSQSCLPMLQNKRDSEEEDCTSWLKTTSMKMVDEFTDVNFGEKQFMKVWNSYMMDHKILADKQVSTMCVKFAREKADELREKCLAYNLISHLTYMCDIGLVPPSTIREVFKIVHQDVSP